jgi:hypothetical protein
VTRLRGEHIRQSLKVALQQLRPGEKLEVDFEGIGN